MGLVHNLDRHEPTIGRPHAPWIGSSLNIASVFGDANLCARKLLQFEGASGLAGIAALTFFSLKKRRGGRNTSNSANNQQLHEAPKAYDPADPATFPSPVLDSDPTGPGGYTREQYQAGRYRGVAEV